MSEGLLIRGRTWSREDIATIGNFIAAHPDLCRAHLARGLSTLFRWRQPNGQFKERAMRDVLLQLHARDHICLPPAGRNPFGRERFIAKRSVLEPGPAIDELLGALRPLRFTMPVERTDLALFDQLLDQFHYLGAGQLVGASVRYFVWSSKDQLLALLSFGSAAWKVAARDEFIGWTQSQRRERLHLIVNNTRFLILPWVHCPHLASHILATSAQLLPRDWHLKYGCSPLLMESFVDVVRFTGTCYKAANWIFAGNTRGRGKRNTSLLRYASSVKNLYLYPLHRQWRSRLVPSGAPDMLH